MAAVVPTIEVRHHRFQSTSYEAFDTVLAAQAAAGFGLIRIVPIDEDFDVAVFERTVPDPPGNPTKK